MPLSFKARVHEAHTIWDCPSRREKPPPTFARPAREIVSLTRFTGRRAGFDPICQSRASSSSSRITRFPSSSREFFSPQPGPGAGESRNSRAGIVRIITRVLAYPSHPRRDALVTRVVSAMHASSPSSSSSLTMVLTTNRAILRANPRCERDDKRVARRTEGQADISNQARKETPPHRCVSRESFSLGRIIRLSREMKRYPKSSKAGPKAEIPIETLPCN